MLILVSEPLRQCRLICEARSFGTTYSELEALLDGKHDNRPHPTPPRLERIAGAQRLVVDDRYSGPLAVQTLLNPKHVDDVTFRRYEVLFEYAVAFRPFLPGRRRPVLAAATPAVLDDDALAKRVKFIRDAFDVEVRVNSPLDGAVPEGHVGLVIWDYRQHVMQR